MNECTFPNIVLPPAGLKICKEHRIVRRPSHTVVMSKPGRRTPTGYFSLLEVSLDDELSAFASDLPSVEEEPVDAPFPPEAAGLAPFLA